MLVRQNYHKFSTQNEFSFNREIVTRINSFKITADFQRRTMFLMMYKNIQ